MSTGANARPMLLTITDLAERWGVSEGTVQDHIRLDGVPFIPFGHGRRLIYRFRLADIERWEASRVRVREKEKAPEIPPPSVAALWDGIDRLGGGKRRKKSPDPEPISSSLAALWDGKIRGGSGKGRKNAANRPSA